MRPARGSPHRLLIFSPHAPHLRSIYIDVLEIFCGNNKKWKNIRLMSDTVTSYVTVFFFFFESKSNDFTNEDRTKFAPKFKRLLGLAALSRVSIFFARSPACAPAARLTHGATYTSSSGRYRNALLPRARGDPSPSPPPSPLDPSYNTPARDHRASV